MKYLFLDTETNDLFDYKKPADAPGQPRLCDIAMLFCDGELLIERTVNHLIKPNGWMLDPNGAAAKVNGLSQERLEREGVDCIEVMKVYGDAIDERRIVVAFNAPFDIKMMRAELRHCGLPDRYIQTRYICAMQGCRAIVAATGAAGKKKAPTLKEACAFFEIEPEPEPHRAIDGVQRVHQIMTRLRNRGMMPAFKDPRDRKDGPLFL